MTAPGVLAAAAVLALLAGIAALAGVAVVRRRVPVAATLALGGAAGAAVFVLLADQPQLPIQWSVVAGVGAMGVAWGLACAPLAVAVALRPGEPVPGSLVPAAVLAAVGAAASIPALVVGVPGAVALVSAAAASPVVLAWLRPGVASLAGRRDLAHLQLAAGVALAATAVASGWANAATSDSLTDRLLPAAVLPTLALGAVGTALAGLPSPRRLLAIVGVALAAGAIADALVIEYAGRTARRIRARVAHADLPEPPPDLPRWLHADACVVGPGDRPCPGATMVVVAWPADLPYAPEVPPTTQTFLAYRSPSGRLGALPFEIERGLVPRMPLTRDGAGYRLGEAPAADLDALRDLAARAHRVCQGSPWIAISPADAWTPRELLAACHLAGCARVDPLPDGGMPGAPFPCRHDGVDWVQVCTEGLSCAALPGTRVECVGACTVGATEGDVEVACPAGGCVVYTTEPESIRCASGCTIRGS